MRGWRVTDDCSADLVIHGWVSSTAKDYANAAGIVFEPLTPEPDLFLPAALTTIESEAFAGIAAHVVVIPATVTSISGNPFAGSGVTTICGYDDTWRSWAENNGYVFVLLDGD